MNVQDKDATIARLTAELEWTEADRNKWLADAKAWQDTANQAEAKLAEANASIERLNANCAALGSDLHEVTHERNVIRAQSFVRSKTIEALNEAGTFSEGIRAAAEVADSHGHFDAADEIRALNYKEDDE